MWPRVPGRLRRSRRGEPMAEVESANNDLIERILQKYQPDEWWPLLEKLVSDGSPVTGVSTKVSEDYLIRKFLQIANTAKRDYDRVLALEKIARMKGYFKSNDDREPAELKVTFSEKRPADAMF